MSFTGGPSEKIQAELVSLRNLIQDLNAGTLFRSDDPATDPRMYWTPIPPYTGPPKTAPNPAPASDVRTIFAELSVNVIPFPSGSAVG